MAVVFYVLAVLFALYCIGVIASKAAGTKFFLVWIAAAILCAGTGVLLQKGLWERLPQPARMTALAVLGVGLACFVAVECFIVSGFLKRERESALYRGARCADEGKRPSAWRWQSDWTGHTSIFRKIRTLSACFQEERR
ncbi:MAG: hypothetical protein ACLRPR_08705 [Eisenbergiella sp.]